MWTLPSSVCAHSRPLCEVLIITFNYENKSEERAPLFACNEAFLLRNTTLIQGGKIRSQGGKAGPFQSTCSDALNTEVTCGSVCCGV